MSFLKNIKISKKIFGGFGLILLLLVGLSITSGFSLNTGNEDFKRYRSIARQTNQAGRVQANVLEARLAVKNFILKPSETNIARVGERTNRALDLIVDFKELVNDDAKLELLSKVEKELKSYLNAFAQVIDLQAKRNDLVNNQLDKIGPQIERKLTAIMESAFKDDDAPAAFRAGVVQRNLLLMRLYVTKFLVTNEKSAYDRALRESAAMRRTYVEMVRELENPIRIQLAREVDALRVLYDNAFADTNEVINFRNRVILGTLDTLGPTIAEEMEILKLSAKKEQDTLGPSASQALQTAVKVTITVAVVSVLLSALAAWIIGTGISRPIITITAAMKRLVGGERTVQIPGQDYSDEVGDMAKAVEVFRQNALEVEKLKIDADQKAFVSAGIIGMANACKETSSIKQLADRAGAFLAEYLNLPTLAFYSVGAEGLRFISGRALDQTVDRRKLIGFGEGLIGQAALAMEVREVSNIPSGSLSISSSLVAANPVVIYQVPFVANDCVIGIAEFASLIKLSPAARTFLDVLRESFGGILQDHISRQSIQRLLDQSREQTAQLAASQKLADSLKEVEATSLAKSKFLASMSHEIRTPMAGVLGMTDLVLGTELTSEQRGWMGSIKASGVNLLRILNEILDQSKLEAGRLEISNVDFKLSTFIKESIGLFTPSTTTKGLDFELYIDETVPEDVYADSLRIGQVLSNLLSNALKFTESGKVTVRVEHKPYPGEEFMLQILVTDSGIGIHDDDQKKLFSSFTQVDGSTSREYGGTGLGLSISKQLVELMGGEIWVESTPKKGSTFGFTILCRASKNTVDTVPLVTTPVKWSASRPLSILVVDDNLINQQLAGAVMELLDHKVAYAENGKIAVDCVEAEDFDLVLMDVRMPVMDGMEATKQIRALESDKSNIVIIALSADIAGGNANEFMRSGMNDVCGKPLDLSLILKAINRHLGETIHTPATAR